MEVSLKDCADILRKAKSIVITTHIHPDGDALGSMLALYFHLLSIGKKPLMILDDKIPAYLKFLPGSENILKPSDTNIEADLLVALDASDQDRISRVQKTVSAKILNIDHHVSNTKFSHYWYVDAGAAATGEIIFALLKSEKTVITPGIAVCLFTAIATDCGFFRFANTTATTLRYAAELIECGVKPNIISEFLTTKPLTNIQTLPNILDSLEIYKTNLGITVASLTISPQVLEKLQNDTDDFINYPRNIEGIDVAVVYKMVGNDEIRISMRSKSIDVSQIALNFGGGGHTMAAGCTINGSVDFAKKQLMATIDKYAKKSKKIDVCLNP